MKSKMMKMLVAALAMASLDLMGCEEKEAAYSDKPENITVKDADGNEYPTVKNADGNEYPTVKIGQQIWMAKNLNVNVPGSMCYENKPENCEKYGRLYTWEAAKMACPSGWHLPSKEEFERLLDIAGGASLIGSSKNLRARSWDSVWGSLDKFGFSALPAGIYNSSSEKFDNLGNGTYFWSSTENSHNRAYYLLVSGSDVYVVSNDRDYGSSVRCLRD